MKNVTIIAFLTIISIQASSQEVSSLLTIRLYHEDRSNPLDGATVELYYGTDYDEKETNDRGEVFFDLETLGIKPGQEIKMLIYKKGYQTIEDTYTVKSNADRIHLPVDKEVKDPTIPLIGHVLNEDSGEVMPGVDVFFLGDYHTVSRQDGSFRLDIPLRLLDEAGDELTITFQKEGYLPPQQTVKLGRTQKNIRIEHFMRPKETPLLFRTGNFTGLLWQLENLNVEQYGSTCYDDDPANCARYGRLYTWEAAQKACASLGEGWRLPTEAEFEQLTFEAGEGYGGGLGSNTGDPKASFRKMMAGEWRPVLGGYREDGKSKEQDKEGFYWTGTTANNDLEVVVFNFSKFGVFKIERPKDLSFSCRCIRE